METPGVDGASAEGAGVAGRPAADPPRPGSLAAVMGLVGAAAAFEDREHFDKTCRWVIESRDKVVGQLEAKGFEVLPSAANFIFARHPQHDAAGLAAKLREQGVIVRHFKQERIAQFLRISIGTPEQNQALIDGLGDL